MIELSANQRDLLIRTALGEAGDKSDSAVAAVVRDIMSGAGDGDVSGRVLAPGRYASWDQRRRELLRHDRDSEEYRRVAQIVDKTTASDAGGKPRSVLELLGHEIGKPPSEPAGKAKPGSVLKSLGLELGSPEGAPQPAPPPRPADMPPGAVSYIQIPGTNARHYIDASGKVIPPANQPASDARIPNILPTAAGLAALPGRLSEGVAQEFTGSREQFRQGVEDIRAGRSATGTGHALLGLAGMAFSPLTGPLHVPAEEIDKITGVPGLGEKAMLLATLPRGGRAAVTHLRPTNRAFEQLVDDIGHENIPEVANRLDSNPSLALMDVAPGVQTRAIAIAKGEPSAGQTHLFNEVERRAANPREQSAVLLRSTLGHAPDTEALVQQMEQHARNVGQQQIQPALNAAGPVDVTDVIHAIDAQIGNPTIRAIREGRPPPLPLSPTQQRLVQLRQDLTYRGTEGEVFPRRDRYFIDPTSNPVAGANDVGAHGIQSRLRAEADNLVHSASGAERNMGRALYDIRNRLVGAIDVAAGNAYRPALEAYSGAMRIPEAFARGMEITSMAKVGEAGLANRPEAWARWINAPGRLPEEIRAAQLGALTVLDNYVGTARQAARVGRDIPDTPFVLDRLEQLFGRQRARQLERLIQDERAKANTNTQLTQQSVTARALAAQRSTAPREIQPISQHVQRLVPGALVGAAEMYTTGMPGFFTGAALATGTASHVAQRLGRLSDVTRNNVYARLASTTHPQERAEILRALRARHTRQTPLTSRGQALTRPLAIALPPAALLDSGRPPPAP